MGHTINNSSQVNANHTKPFVAAWTRYSFLHHNTSSHARTRCIVRTRTPAQRQQQACRADSSIPGNVGQGYASYVPTPPMGTRGMQGGVPGNYRPPPASGWSASVQAGGMRPPNPQPPPRQQTNPNPLGSGQGMSEFSAPSSASSSSSQQQQQQQQHNVDFQRQFWSTLDICGWTGSVAGAVLFLLTQELWLAALPISMPLLALYASREKEKLDIQQAQALARTHYDTALNHQYSKDAQSLASEMRQLQSSVESGLTGTVDALGTLRVLEARLAQLEGNVLSASKLTLESTERLSNATASMQQRNTADLQTLQSQLVNDVQHMQAQLVGDVRQEVAALGDRVDAGPMLSAVDGRLAALESSLNGLEASTADALKTLGTAMHATVSEVLANQPTIDGQQIAQHVATDVRSAVSDVVDAKITSALTTMQHTLDATATTLQNHTTTLQNHTTTLNTLNHTTSMVNTTVNKSFNAMEDSLHMVNTRMNNIDGGLTMLQGTVGGMGQGLTMMQESVQGVQESVQGVHATLGGVVEQVSGVRGALGQVVGAVGDLDAAVASGMGGVQQAVQHMDTMLSASMDDVRAAAAAANAAVESIRTTDIARREQLTHLDQKLTRQLTHMDKGFDHVHGQVNTMHAAMSDMQAVMEGAVGGLRGGVQAMQESLGEQMQGLENALDTVIEETIALRAEALTARSEELDRAVQLAITPLLTTMNAVKAGVEHQQEAVDHAVQQIGPTMATNMQRVEDHVLQGVHKEMQGVLRSHARLYDRIDKVAAAKSDIQAAVAAALQPYKAAVYELQSAVGNQGGQLSSLLPTVAEGLQQLQEAVKVLAEDQATLHSLVQDTSTSHTEAVASVPVLTTQEVQQVVDTTFKPYKTMLENMQRSMGSQAGQLSSILPTLADDVQDMRTTLTDTLHTIATQAAHVMEVAAQQQEEKGGGHGVSVREVEAVVEQVMQPYSTMMHKLETRIAAQQRDLQQLAPHLQQQVRDTLALELPKATAAAVGGIGGGVGVENKGVNGVVDAVVLKKEIQGVVESALRPYKGMIESLQTAVGNQGGQLSSTLPGLIHELQEMASALQDLLEVQAAQGNAAVLAASRPPSTPSSPPPGTVTVDELLTVLDPIISAVQKLATARVVGGDEEGMGRLQRDVQHVTDAVQALTSEMHDMARDLSSLSTQLATPPFTTSPSTTNPFTTTTPTTNTPAAVAAASAAAASLASALQQSRRRAIATVAPAVVEQREGIVGSSFVEDAAPPAIDVGQVDERVMPRDGDERWGTGRPQQQQQEASYESTSSRDGRAIKDDEQSTSGRPWWWFGGLGGLGSNNKASASSTITRRIMDATSSMTATRENTVRLRRQQDPINIPSPSYNTPPVSPPYTSYNDMPSSLPRAQEQQQQQAPPQEAPEAPPAEVPQEAPPEEQGGPLFASEEEREAMRRLISRKEPVTNQPERTYEEAADWFKYAATDKEEDIVEVEFEDDDEMDEMERHWKRRDPPPPPASPPSAPAQSSTQQPTNTVQRLIMQDDGATMYVEEPTLQYVDPATQQQLQYVDQAAAAASDRFLVAARERAARAAESAAVAAAVQTANNVQLRGGNKGRAADPGNLLFLSLP